LFIYFAGKFRGRDLATGYRAWRAAAQLLRGQASGQFLGKVSRLVRHHHVERVQAVPIEAGVHNGFGDLYWANPPMQPRYIQLGLKIYF
jgi:hypothetical protein